MEKRGKQWYQRREEKKSRKSRHEKCIFLWFLFCFCNTAWRDWRNCNAKGKKYVKQLNTSNVYENGTTNIDMIFCGSKNLYFVRLLIRRFHSYSLPSSADSTHVDIMYEGGSWGWMGWMTTFFIHQHQRKALFDFAFDDSIFSPPEGWIHNQFSVLLLKGETCKTEIKFESNSFAFIVIAH